MTSPSGLLTAPACHPTKEVNEAEELTNLSITIGGLLQVDQKAQRHVITEFNK